MNIRRTILGLLVVASFSVVATPAAAASCVGTWQYSMTDVTSVSCENPAPGICVSTPNATAAYSSTPTCASASPSGTTCTVSGTNTCKWNAVATAQSSLVVTDVYTCVDAGGVAIAPSCATETVSATLLANPTQITKGESVLLTWSSTNATSCTGTNFTTGNTTTGSVLVSPQADTKYILTCTGPSGSATTNATVLVVVPLPPDSNDFSVSCRAHPPHAAPGEDVLWSSTVSGPQGTYAYFWSGTDGLTGTANQVFKQYGTPGAKTASLTVTFTPQAQASAANALIAFVKSLFIPQTALAAQCLAGQTAVPTLNYAGASCSGGTIVGRDGDILDGAQIGLFPDGWLENECSTIGGQAGDCCELAMKASNNIGGGFPPNSYWQVRVHRGGTVSMTDATYIQTVQCSGHRLDYSCSSVAGIMGNRCVAGGDDKNGAISKTVLCDNPVQVGAAQCGDSVDNDGDGLIDAQDPGCLSGGGGAGGTYNSGDTTEGGGSDSGTAQCSDGIDNNGDGAADFPDDPGCSSADDRLEMLEPADLALSINPPLIKKDQQCTITLTARNVATCTLSGTGVSRIFTAVSGIVTTKEVVTPGLSQTATYTLSCTGINGKVATKKVDCKIAPTFEEI